MQENPAETSTLCQNSQVGAALTEGRLQPYEIHETGFWKCFRSVLHTAMLLKVRWTPPSTIAGTFSLTKSQTVSWSAPTPKGVTPDVLKL